MKTRSEIIDAARQYGDACWNAAAEYGRTGVLDGPKAKESIDLESAFIQVITELCVEPEYLTADQLTESGQYWHLPAEYHEIADEPEAWLIVVWHPEDPNRDRSGLFVGPLKAPVKKG